MVIKGDESLAERFPIVSDVGLFDIKEVVTMLSKTLVLVFAFAFAAVLLTPICNAEIWYQYDFEPDEGNWTLGAGTELSTEFAHSGTHSIMSDAVGDNGRYAEIFLDMIPDDAKTVVVFLQVDLQA